MDHIGTIRASPDIRPLSRVSDRGSRRACHIFADPIVGTFADFERPHRDNHRGRTSRSLIGSYHLYCFGSAEADHIRRYRLHAKRKSSHLAARAMAWRNLGCRRRQDTPTFRRTRCARFMVTSAKTPAAVSHLQQRFLPVCCAPPTQCVAHRLRHCLPQTDCSSPPAGRHGTPCKAPSQRHEWGGHIHPSSRR